MNNKIFPLSFAIMNGNIIFRLAGVRLVYPGTDITQFLNDIQKINMVIYYLHDTNIRRNSK